MLLTDRFQLLALKRDEGVRTFEAREIATGRPVLVHLFADKASPLNRALLAKVDALPEKERVRVIDRGVHEGGVYLVTDRLAEYAGLREWLGGRHADNPKPLEIAGAWHVPEPAPRSTVDDQLAHLFDTVRPPIPAAVTGLGPLPSPPVLTNTGEHTLKMPPADDPAGTIRIPIAQTPPPAPPPPASSPPGEFTRLFAPVLRPAPPRVPTPPRVPVPPANEPGEFTRQFAMPPAQEVKPPQNPAPQAGEFTKMIQRPVPALPRVTPPLQMHPPGAPPSDSPPAQPASPPASQPGEFTQMLQAQRPAATPMPPSNQPSTADEFARYFQSPMTPTPQGGSPNLAPPPPTPPQAPKGAGEFTQIFGRSDMPLAPPPPAPAAQPPQAPGNATNVFNAPRPTPLPPLNPVTQARNVVPQGPGEYTRMFSAPAPMILGQPQAPQTPQVMRLPESRPRRNNSRLPLLLMVGGAVLLIIAVIVYFVMRARPA